jgi:tetraacyldisaccharide 4'-kinase
MIALAALGAPLEAAHAAALRARQALIDAGVLPRWRLPRPIVSVGNLTVGGTSKTPMVLWLAEQMRRRGFRPGVALRGYGGAYDVPWALVPAPAPAGSPSPAGSPPPAGSAALYGDEACLLARRLPGVPVAVGRERALAALGLIREAGVDLVILDDGFQHRRLERAVDVVLLDARAPFGNGRLLPAGPLREPPSALRRAGFVVLTRRGEDPAAEEKALRHSSTWPLAPGARLRSGTLRPAGLFDPAGWSVEIAEVQLRGCIAFCGIARPASFARSLRQAGLLPAALRAYGDHHPFSALELGGLEAEAARLGAGWLVTTEKDLERLRPWSPRPARLAALRVEIDLEDGEGLAEEIAREIAAAGGARAAA